MKGAQDSSSAPGSRGLAAAWSQLCAVLVATLALRALSGAFLVGDEFHTLRDLRRSFGELASSYDEHGSGLAFPLLQKAVAGVLGESVLVYRLPAVAGAVGTALLVGPVARALFSPASAVLASLAVATGTMHVFYSRYGRAYSLSACLVLGLVLCVVRALEERERRAWKLGIVLTAGFLPAVHLSTLPLVLALALAALWNARERGSVRSIAVSFAGAGVLAFSLHAQALSDLRTFLADKVMEGAPSSFGPLDVALLLFGEWTAAWVCVLALPLCAAALVARRGKRAWLALSGPLALALVLLAAQPPGLSYAYARYLFAGWPLLLMLLAWGWMELVSRLPLRAPARTGLGLALGAVLVVAPRALELGRAWEGRFSCSNLALRPLPAFDAAWPRASNFYGVLASSFGRLRIAEFPALKTRNLLLYRHHWRAHGQDVFLAHCGDSLLARLGPPYVDLLDAESLARAGIEYVVVHHDIDDELANYWSFVHDEAWPLVRTPGDEPLMAAHSDWGPRTGHGEDVPRAEGLLRRAFGEPVYADGTVRVWQTGR